MLKRIEMEPRAWILECIGHIWIYKNSSLFDM